MKRTQRFSPRFAALSCLTVLVLATVALAGPPLICHPFDIGAAKSLPFTGTAWNLSGSEGYNTGNLVRDTLAILDSGAPVIVRMETLRRATLYAGKDPQAARELLTRLHARADAGETARNALALFDFGYLVETYAQWFNDHNPAAGIDGYSFVKKALALRANDPQMEFAAALITSFRGPAGEHGEHAQKAMAGAKTDALLSRNLSSDFIVSMMKSKT